MSKTIRRDRLMKLAQEGKLILVRSYHFDDMGGESRCKSEMPVRFSTSYSDFVEGVCNVHEHDFSGSSGGAYVNEDGTIHLRVHSNCFYDFRLVDGGAVPIANAKTTKAKLPHNARMQQFLLSNGVDCVPKYIPDGSLKGTWRLYNPDQKWSLEIAAKLNALGFVDYDGKPVGEFSGNGGSFSVFVRGHDEMLNESAPTPAPAEVPQTEKPIQPPVPAPGIIRTKHTQKGYDLFVVQLPARVSKPQFMAFLLEAKKMGGWYSSYVADGAIPGFQFKTELKALAFLHIVDGQPLPERELTNLQTTQAAPAEPIQPATAPNSAPVDLPAKLRTQAEALTAKIEDKRRPLTQNPTPKRNYQYRSRLHDSDNLERTQKALLALAVAYEVGNVPPILVNIRTKAQVEPLVYKGTEGGSYYEVIPSIKYRDTSPSGIALQAMIDSEPKDNKAREISLLEQQISLSDIPGYFPTPPELVKRLIDYAQPKAGDFILEPSAGSGAIACACNSRSKVEACEVNFTLRKLLTLKGVELVGEDFMEFQPSKLYDAVLMNPPFEKSADLDQIRFAWRCLKDGGKLAAICSPGFTFRQDAKATEFSNWISEIRAEVEDIPAGSFKQSGTGVAAKFIFATK